VPESRRIKVYKPGDVILDTYLVEDIRSGAMGNVYIADHKKWKIKVAIKAPNEKILSNENLFNRVLKEADAWIDLGLHPNIAYCYYVRQVDEVPHIFIEYVNGGNLREWIADGKCFNLKVGLDLAIQFCHGMEQAHNHGMIHRDIKPANILMTREGTLKVTDFGLVKTSGQDTPYAGAQGGLRGDTQFASVMGTPAYMSPEQYETPLDVDRRTDIYSFGVCMYEMFCGKLPYDQTSAALPAAYIAKIARKARLEPAQLRRDIPADLANILKKCVSLEREERYSFFEELRADLTLSYRRLFDDSPPHADVETLNIKADGLNNRGVSYLDLGRKEEAIKCWEEALRIDPVHFESAYNHGYLKWNRAEMTQSAVLRRLEGCMDTAGNKAEHWTALAWLYLEMGELRKIKEIQQPSQPTLWNLEEMQGWSPKQDDDKFLAAWEMEEHRLLRTFSGHTGNISSIALSPNGRYVLSASGDKTLKLWEIATGKEIRAFTGHTDYIKTVAITCDGRFALSGGQDKTLKLWEISTGKEIRIFTGHTGSIDAVAITPDSQLILSGSIGDHSLTLKFWEIATGREISAFAVNSDRVTSVVITPDCRFILTGSMRHNTLKLWEIANGKEVRIFTGHTDRVTTIVISSDGRFALSGSYDNTLKLWEIATGKEIRTFTGHSAWVRTVAITPDGRFALSGSCDQTLKLWEISTGKEVRTLSGHNDDVNSVAITPDGRFAISGSSDQTLKLWKIFQPNASNDIFPLTAVIAEISSVMQQNKHLASLIEKTTTFIKRGLYAPAVKGLREAQMMPGYERDSSILDMLAVCRASADGIVKGLINGWCRRTLRGHTGSVNAVAITPDGRFALSGGQDKTLKLWEIATGQEIRTFTGHTHDVYSVAITPNGRFVFSGSYKTLKLWEIETGKEIMTLTGHSHRVECVVITPDGKFAFSGSRELKLWEIATGNEIRTFEGQSYGVNSVAVTPDSRFVLSGSNDNTLKLWEIATGREIRTFTGHEKDIISIATTPDGRFALSGSENEMKLWEIETGKEIDTIPTGHNKNWVNSYAITPDGKFGLSGHNDDTLKLWKIETSENIQTFTGHSGGVSSIAITPDGRFALSGSWDNTLKLWEFDWDWEFI